MKSKSDFLPWVFILCILAFLIYQSGPRESWAPDYATNHITLTRHHWFTEDEKFTVRWREDSNAWCALESNGVWKVVVTEPRFDPQR